MAIQPVRDLLYVIPFEPAPKSSLIVGSAAHKWRAENQGIVKYRGPLTTGEIKVGMHVLFPIHEGIEVLLESEGKLIAIREIQISAILNDDEAKWLITLDKVKLLLGKAAAQARQTFDSNEQHLVDRIVARVQEQVDSEFLREIQF